MCRSALIAGVLLSLFAPADAQPVEIVDHSALRVCADPAAPPFSTEALSGFENRIADLFAKDLGVPVHYTWFPNTFGFYRRTLNLRRCDIVIGAPAGLEMAQSTKPYYRSTFAVLTRSGDHLAIAALDDPVLRDKRIGVQAQTPVADLIARNGLADRMHAYDLMVDSRAVSIGREMAEDLLANKIDVAIVWGPVAAHLADLHRDGLRFTMLGETDGGVQLAYAIAMAVRKGEPQWRAQVDRFIDDHRPQIAAILRDAHVPLLPLDQDAP